VLLQDKVLEVQPEQLLNGGGSATGGSVRLASGGTIEYDWLVVSLGAAADPRGVPGVREHARPFVSLEDAEYVAQQLAAYEARAATGQPPAAVAVVGAGYAGVELAAVVGERLKGKARVALLTPGADILEAAPAGQREAAVQVRLWLCVALCRCPLIRCGVHRQQEQQQLHAAAAGAGAAATVVCSCWWLGNIAIGSAHVDGQIVALTECSMQQQQQQ
jgi:hypothetical protein